MKFYSTLIAILLAGTLLAQNRPQRTPQPFQVLFQELNIFPVADNRMEICYSYRIPYNRLVFEKKDNLYQASFNISYEITKENGEIVNRDFYDGTILVDNFKDTDSDDKFFQGMLKSKTDKGLYNLSSVLFDKNSRSEHKLKELKIDTSSAVILNPVITEEKKEICNGEIASVLSNWESSIPFSNAGYIIYIPIVDSTLKVSKIKITSNEDTIFTDATFNYSLISPPELCDGKIIMSAKAETKLRALELKGVSGRFKEGNLSVALYPDKGGKPLKVLHLQVRWYKKPQILNMPELAIKVLRNIESPELVDSLLSLNEKKYPAALYDYWKKLDPKPETEYNDLMREYYERVDYAAMNFSSINGRRGFETDRGKIYIQFGKPDQTERGSNLNGKVTETWYYERQKRMFTFTDNSGTGEFKLDNG